MTSDEQFDLKPIHTDSIEAAMEKMKRYRLLNEPENAESICRDILLVDPDHREARIGLLLCISDQFGRKLTERWTEATAMVETLEGDYDSLYYRGILCERRAKAHFNRRTPQGGCLTHTWLTKAMGYFEQAAEYKPPGVDAAILRWNTCARMIMKYGNIQPPVDDDAGPELLE